MVELVINKSTQLESIGYSMVMSSETLESLVAKWCERKVLAVDTEFLRTDTY